MDKDLWDLFQDDFKNFTLATLTSIRVRYLQNLRNHLRGRGVYVAPNTKRTTIAQTLFDVIAEEEQHEWTDDEIQEVCTSMGTIKSMNLRYRIPQTPTATATAIIPPDGLATSPKSAQLTATATIPPGMQIPMTPQTPYYPQTPTAFVPYQPAQQQYNPQQPAQQHTLLQSTLQRPLDPGGGTASYKKEAATVAKMYTDSRKYDGVSESFDFKLAIFEVICRRAAPATRRLYDRIPYDAERTRAGPLLQPRSLS